MYFSFPNFVTAVAAISVAIACPAHAGSLLTLSDLSSDETSANDLSATLDFSVFGSTLSLTVANDTLQGVGFDLDAIYFNGLSNVTGLSLTSPPTWWTLVAETGADGFGVFDFALINDVGNNPGEIGPQQSLAFSFDIFGTGPFLDTDFTTEFSSTPPGDTEALAAGKFVNGPGDDSAYGAVIPEPGTALLTLLGAAIVGLAGRRR